MASLKADSLITVCATRSRMRTWRKIGISVAGSVEASDGAEQQRDDREEGRG